MLYFRTGFKKGTCGRPGGQAGIPLKRSCGRVARQSSAKAPTAVRIRSGPRKKGDQSLRLIPLYYFSLAVLKCYRSIYALLPLGV